MDEDRRKVEDALNSVMDEVDRRYMRQKQAEMYKCASQCFEKPNGNRLADETCFNNCKAEAMWATDVVSKCLEEYQETLVNCFKTCADSVRYTKIGSPEIEAKLQSCTSGCVAKFLDQKSNVVQKILDYLKTNK